MTKKVVATIHAVTVNKFSDEELAEMMEAHGFDTTEELLEEAEKATRASLAPAFDNSVELLEVVSEIEEVGDSDVDHYGGHLDELDDGGGCMETAEEMNEIRND